MKLQEQFQSARRAGVPIALITTSDPTQTIRTVCQSLNGKIADTPVLQHDCIRGLTGVQGSKAGEDLAASFGGPLETSNTIQCLDMMYSKCREDAALLEGAIIFMHNAHRTLNATEMIQAVWNLRDVFESTRTMLVLLGTSATVPLELRQDIIIMEDPLPTPEQITDIIASIAQDAQKSGANIDPENVRKDAALADMLTGVSGFGAKQVFAMSITKNGIKRDTLFDRKRKLIEQTPGLSVWLGTESFDDLGGLENLKRFLTLILQSGETPIRAIGFIDEIEKALAAAGTDSSGTTQDQLSVFLRVMQDDNIPGIILIGPPGTGKSAIAKASGAIAGAPVVAFDLGAAKSSLVGQSEDRIRTMMQVFQAVSQKKGLFIATCNGIASLPPELRRRFRLGTFFVDLPGPEERENIWRIGCKRFGLRQESSFPKAKDWSGAEIIGCCEMASRMNCSLEKAQEFIVPAAVSAGEKIQGLRQQAHKRYISANKPGLYELTDTITQPPSTGRNMQF